MSSVDLEYVKRRKRKKLASLIALVGGAGLAVYIILAFIGKTIGTFSIQLENDSVILGLAKNQNDFSGKNNNTTTFLRMNNMPKIESWCYTDFARNDLTESRIHNEETDLNIAKVQGKTNTVYFFKYTFYVVNLGNTYATYDLRVRITENNKPENYDSGAATLDNYLRVAIYSTYDIGTVNEKTDVDYYAKMAEDGDPQYDKSGKLTKLEHIGDSNTPYVDYAFEDEEVICNRHEPMFSSKQYRMYTLVFWYENFDPQHGPVVPKNGSLKLGVDIKAYEYSKNE